MATYLSKAVFDFDFQWTSPPTFGVDRGVNVIQHGYGVDRVDDYGAAATETMRLRVQPNDLAGMADVVEFFEARVGGYEAFWIPTDRRDVVINANVGLLGSQFSVDEKLDYNAAFGGALGTGRYLSYHDGDPANVQRRKVATVGNSGGNDLLNLDGVCGLTLTPDTAAISFLLLCRFAGDEIVESFGTDGLYVDVGVVELPEEYPQ